MKIKLFCYVITIALLLTSAAGCGKKGNSSAPENVSSKDAIEITEEKRTQMDLNGKEFTIVTWSNDMFDHVDGESDYGDAVLARIKAVEEELNCVLNFVVKDPDTMVQEAVASMLSGEKYCDIMLPILWKTAGLISGGVVQDLNSISTLDLKKPYWDKMGNDYGNFNGKQYFSVNSMVRSYYSSMSAILFNKRIVGEMGLENPYDLFKDKKWTVSKMREMAKAATKEKDGIAGMTVNDQWGIAAVDPIGILGLSVLSANKTNFIIKNDKGTLQYNMGSPSVRNIMSYGRDWISNDNTIFKGASVEESREAWLQGNALFYSYCLGDIKKSSEVVDEFGIVPFPMGDQLNTPMTEYSQFMDWNRSVICVPATVAGQDLLDVGHLLDSIAYHSQNEEKANLDEYKNRYAQDDDAVGVIDMLARIASMDYSQLVATSTNMELFATTFTVYYDSMGDTGADIAAKIEEVSNAGKTALNNYITALK